jgi:hypothetical protein
MKRVLLLMLVMVVTQGCCTSSGVTGQKMLTGGVYSPQTGIICDRQVGICADSQGISMAYTQEYLGEAAQKKQMALMRQGGYNQTYFILSNGVACNTADKKCYVGEFDSTVDAAHTKALFGN